DVLLVDDVQFIGGRESTQEEFFHTFNALHDAHKQIVLTSDRPPKEIKSLEDSLRTRFEWGLTADVTPPDIETRISILQRKAKDIGFELPGEVADFIAKQLKKDIRQLEGTVKKLYAFKLMDGSEPTIELAERAIADIVSEQMPWPATVEKIISEVGRTFNVPAEDLRSNKQNSAVSNARQIAMYIIREVTGTTMEKIGQEFGGRNHSTVVYGISKVEKNLTKDAHMRAIVEDIIKNCRQ
ncbi:MAG: chromosomal replication initiator protein DnaA, partial [Oscillospiraceae bacterium]|nr:chromosomal replication initiator protein DnaA [Oscillospiraceae bacterium]